MLNRRSAAAGAFLCCAAVFSLAFGMTGCGREKESATLDASPELEHLAWVLEKSERAGALIPSVVWDSSVEVLHFGPDNLYEYINGAAESYFKQNFEALEVVTFVDNADNSRSITIEFFDMGEDDNASAMFESQRAPGEDVAPYGVDGYKGGYSVTFWRSQYYVKVRATWKSEQSAALMHALAEAADKSIPDDTEEGQ